MRDVHPTPSQQSRRGSSIPRRLLALIAAAALAACSTATLPTPSAGPTPTASPVPTATLGPEFPVTLIDDEGTAVTLAAEPQRIVSLSPANTETAFSLGAGPRLVGGTAYDDYPAEAAALPDVATYQGVLMEQLVTARPDLVLALGNGAKTPPDVIKIRDLGIPVIVLYAADVPGVLHDIELIGDAVGSGAEARQMTAAMQLNIDAIAAATSALDHPRTFYELGLDPEIYGPADDSFLADMVALAGGAPITTGSTSAYAISLERLVTADPEVIVLATGPGYGDTPELIAARAGWGGMTAVRTGALRPVDDIIVTRPGPRLAEGLRALALAIHPDLELP